MKRCVSILALLLFLALQMPAQAISVRTNFASPSLAFDGTTAKCTLFVEGATTDKITATLELHGEAGRVGYWEGKSINGRLVIDKTATVTRGQSYELTATVYINGELQVSAPVTGTCK